MPLPLDRRYARRLTRWLQSQFGRADAATHPSVRRRSPATHVIIIDGTMSSLDAEGISNPGLTYHLLQEMGSAVSLFYQPGLQLSHWRKFGDILAGRGINRQIRAAYGWLASRYRPGDRVFLFGYSRGGYAVRSLAGIICRVGLLRAEMATERHVEHAYRHYRHPQSPQATDAFRDALCHDTVPIEMIGVWDTVKSLGINAPLLWRLSVPRHAFHDHHLGCGVKRGYHALALKETRVAYSPVLWESDPDFPCDLEQMWFRGSHGDVGGQLAGFHPARPLANIPLVWMLAKAEAAGLPLPDGWRARFPQDARAPSTGTFWGMGRWLLTRRARRVGTDVSEAVHPSVAEAESLARAQAGSGLWPLKRSA